MDGAKQMMRYFKELGCEETGIAGPWGEHMGQGGTEGNPVAYGEYNVGAEKTLIMYMMYDTMPIFEPEKWVTPPFEGRIIEWTPFSKVLIGRGAVNTKGPQVVCLNALLSIEAVVGKLPVNVKFVAEGDEERTSKGLWPFIKERGEWLRKADALYFPGIGTNRKGIATPISGTEGILWIDLVCSGEYWNRGPTKYAVHGSRKSILDSPAWRMIDALSTIASDNGNNIKIEGWCDNIERPSEEDLRLIDKMVEMGFGDPEALKEELGAKVFIDEINDPREILMKQYFSPIFNIDGIYGGRIGPGAGSIVPLKVTSKHCIRLRPNQSPEYVLQKLRAHLDKCGYNDIQINIIGKREPVKNNWNTDVAKALFKTYDEFDVPFIRTPPTIQELSPAWPANIFVKGLGLEVIGGSIGYGERAHTVNEMYVIEGAKKIHGIADVEKFIASFIYHYASET